MGFSYQELGVRELDNGEIEFDVTDQHLKLLRHQVVCWLEDETSVGIHPVRPYGTKNISDDMYRILGDDAPSIDQFAILHKQTGLALQIVLKTGKMKAATFYAHKFQQDWKERSKNAKRRKAESPDVIDVVSRNDDDGDVPFDV